MKFCARCGEALEQRIPDGDNRARACCPSCDAIFYENPRVVVGCIVEAEDEVLLCRRAIEPRHGYWTCPGGFLEIGEGLVEGATRETWEEALARVEVLGHHATFDLPHIGQLYVYFRARLRDGKFGAGEESLESKLFRPVDIPWDELAFPVFRHALQFWCEDGESGQRRSHHGVVRKKDGATRYLYDSYALTDHLVQPLGTSSESE